MPGVGSRPSTSEPKLILEILQGGVAIFLRIDTRSAFFAIFRVAREISFELREDEIKLVHQFHVFFVIYHRFLADVFHVDNHNGLREIDSGGCFACASRALEFIAIGVPDIRPESQGKAIAFYLEHHNHIRSRLLMFDLGIDVCGIGFIKIRR